MSYYESKEVKLKKIRSFSYIAGGGSLNISLLPVGVKGKRLGVLNIIKSRSYYTHSETEGGTTVNNREIIPVALQRGKGVDNFSRSNNIS